MSQTGAFSEEEAIRLLRRVGSESHRLELAEAPYVSSSNSIYYPSLAEAETGHIAALVPTCWKMVVNGIVAIHFVVSACNVTSCEAAHAGTRYQPELHLTTCTRAQEPDTRTANKANVPELRSDICSCALATVMRDQTRQQSWLLGCAAYCSRVALGVGTVLDLHQDKQCT